mmetsp:Transcript_27077/g.43827  ORF Transcript_27077/g.43827 Transcript_27077/m.43827 type:complete len:206 (+) Transcript_27077:1600-2217(+)
MDAIPKGFGVRMVGKTLPTKHRTTRRLKLCAEAQNSQACNWARCHGHGALRNRQEKFLPEWARCHHFGTNWDLSKKLIFFKRHQCASRKNSGIPHVLPENILEHSGTPIWFPMVRSPNSGTSIDRAFDSSPCPTSHDEASYVHVHVPQQSSSLRDEIAGWAPNAVGWLGCSHARSRRNAEENAVCLRGSEGIILWYPVFVPHSPP